LFIRDEPAKVETLAAAAAHDTESVRTTAHAIKGSAATFGALTLVQLTNRIEQDSPKASFHALTTSTPCTPHSMTP
jgi:HPt (histidine-containing phosphotransfer) domain-containing protein